MTSPTPDPRLAYADPESPAQMHADCEAVGRRLARAAQSAVGPVPSIHFDEFPREVAKRDIQITDAATRLANALHLHLD